MAVPRLEGWRALEICAALLLVGALLALVFWGLHLEPGPVRADRSRWI